MLRRMVRRRRALLGGLAALGAAAVGAPLIAHARRDHEHAGPAELRIATGPPGGVFREIGGALAGVLRQRLPGTAITCVPTDASLSNLTLLDQGKVDLAFAAVDTVAAGMAEGRPRDITAVARLFDSWMQVLVPVESSIASLADLDGQAVAAGAEGSGTRFTVERLIAQTALRPRLVTATQDAGASALAAGSVAAWFTFTGVPTPAVRALAAKRKLRLLPLDAYLVDMTNRFGAVYNVATLPSTTYPGIAGTSTFITPNLLLARPAVSDRVVETVTAGLFGELSHIAQEHPEVTEINTRSGSATMPVRLHPGALEYFRSMKPYS
jgi:uncharacterized protein